jgi:tetratricopeptide (TPR) repeat protein
MSADDLKATIERLKAGAHSDADVVALRRAFLSGEITLASGERAVALGGDASDTVVITGSGNIVLKGGDAATRQILDAMTPPRLYQLPSDLADFTGRGEEINELIKVLAEGNGRVAISAIGGMGGVGKTSLAVHVAHQLVDRYPDAQIVVEMRGTSDEPTTPIAAMANVIHAFHPQARLSDDIEQVAQDYRSALAGKRVLVVLDNASNAAQVRRLVPPSPCGLIVTSRRTIALAGVRPINLDAMQKEEARELLQSIMGENRASLEQLDAIAKLCGRLPLALRVAGTFLVVHRDWTVDEYIKALSDERKRLAQLRQDDLDVEAVLALSVNQLERENSELATRWRMLAVFPASFDRAAAAAVWEVELEEARDSLSALLERSLVLYEEETARYRLHDLARLLADSRLSESERGAGHYRHAAHYLNVLTGAKELYKRGGEAFKKGLALFDLEWPNIQAGQSWAASHTEKDNAAAELCNDYPNAGVYILNLRQHPRDRIRWLETALDAARNLKQRNSEDVHLGNLGIVHKDLGEIGRAIELYEQRLPIAREMGDRNGEGATLGNLGNAYYLLGETRRSIEFYEQALTIAREIGERRIEGIALGCLGLAYADLGKTHRAIESYEQQLVITREIGDRHIEGLVLGNLGIAYGRLGETHRSIVFYDRSLAIAREIGDRRSEGNALANKSIALDGLGDRTQAIALLEDALEIFEQIEDPSAAKAREQLAEWRGQK